MIVDTEVHLLHPEAREPDYLAENEEPVRRAIHEHEDFPLLKDRMTVDALIQSMQKNRIDKCLIMGLPWSDFNAHKKNNRFIESVVENHPHKFRGMYIPHLDNIKEEIQNIKQLTPDRFIGVKLIPGWQHMRIDNSELAPLLETVESENLFLMVHTDHSIQSLDGDVPYRLLSVLKEHPNLNVLAPHLGGLLCLYGLNPKIKPLLENVHFITSVSLTMRMVKYAADVDPDKVIFGTDFPFNHCHNQGSLIEDLHELPLSEEVESKVLGQTANELFDCHGW